MAVSLACRNLCFGYGDKEILKQISFSVNKGRFCAVLGRNGCGKTTLIHCIGGILQPGSGQVFIQGRALSSLSRNGTAALISLVPQEYPDIFPYRVLDVVVMGRAPFLGLYAKPAPGDYKMAVNALRALNAQDLAHKNFNRISGGERRMVLLARSLAQKAGIMLLDEPTNQLDFNNQYHLLAVIRDLCRKRGLTIVASMHDPNMAALFADEIIMIKNGGIMTQGSCNAVMTRENIAKLYATKSREIRVSKTKAVFLPTHVLEEN